MFVAVIGVLFVLLCLGIGTLVFGSFFSILESIVFWLDDGYYNLKDKFYWFRVMRRRSKHAKKIKALRASGKLKGADYRNSVHRHVPVYWEKEYMHKVRERKFIRYNPEYLLQKRKDREREEMKRITKELADIGFPHNYNRYI